MKACVELSRNDEKLKAVIGNQLSVEVADEVRKACTEPVEVMKEEL